MAAITGFSSLNNYEVNAKPAAESKYPWLARVIHSRSADVPHMCTAVCIEKAIFITAARCIYTLKVRYTSIMYMSKRFEAKVFVVPSKPTKQMFDDIGFIVVDIKNAKMDWKFIKLFNKVNRTDEVFQWYAQLNKMEKIKYKVLGYTTTKDINRKPLTAERKYDLTELNVVATHDICLKMLEHIRKSKTNGFGVPCYYSCSYELQRKNDSKCHNYHGVEGGALIDTTTNKLIGIATWGPTGARADTIELPVGFSTVNSENFFKDLTCARRIRENNKKLVMEGYYQKLCDEK